MSAELEKSIKEIVDKRVKELYGKDINVIRDSLERIENIMVKFDEEYPPAEELSNIISTIEKDIKIVKRTIAVLDEQGMQQMVAKTLLDLMPEFKVSISNEIKSHLTAIAEYVIDNFKEKE